MSELLPIDIHLNKLLDWLISRRHCNRDFQLKLNFIRSRLKDAIEDMPANDKITEILSGNLLNYYSCLQILEILKETESDSKNIFGYYSSKRMKDWQEIINLYEKDNLYLAEGALILTRNINYEIPSIRKQITKLQNSEAECLRKSADFLKQSAAIKNQHAQAAAKLGIKGENVRSELIQLMNELKPMIEDILKHIPDLKSAMEYYTQFVKYMNKLDDFTCTPMLYYLQFKGNTTYYEYKTGIVPTSIEETQIESLNEDRKNDTDDQIDFGDNIDYGDDTASSSTGNGNGDFVHISKDDCIQDHDADTINWEIENTEISIIETDTAIAKGEDALTIMEHRVTRNNIINEIYELEGFFDHRIFDYKNESNLISESQLNEMPTLFHKTTEEHLSSYLNVIRIVLNKLTNGKITVLFMMQDDYKYFEKLIEKLNKIYEGIDKALVKSSVMKENAKEINAKQAKLAPHLVSLIKTTQVLQKHLEAAISSKYKNRPVNIIGGVQSLQV